MILQSTSWKKLLKFLDSNSFFVFKVFLLTRLMILLIVILMTQIEVVPETRCPVEVKISINLSTVLPKIKPLLIRGDAGWYIQIARDSYERIQFNDTQQRSWAFFPLFPLILRAFAHFTGEFEFTGAAVSSFFFLLALIFFHRLILEWGFEGPAADKAIQYICVFPATYFFGIPMTESLFLFLILGSFYYAKRDRWLIAATLGALASATRFVGLLLLPSLFILYWQTHKNQRFNYRVTSLLLIPTGISFYMIFLYFLTGNALAFMDIQAAWSRKSDWFFLPVWKYFLQPEVVSSNWSFELLNIAVTLLVFVCGFSLLIRKEYALCFFTLLSIIIPLSTSSTQSMTRYASIIFPVFMVLGDFARSSFKHFLILMTFISILSMMAVFFAFFISIAIV